MLSQLKNLPRDSRDTLFLLAVIAWIISPHVPHLPWWCNTLAGAMLLWRGALAWTSRSLPSRWWLLILLVLTVSATYATYRTILGRDAGVTLIVVLFVLKTLELRARRDAFVVFFLGFFTMLTNFFFSQSLLVAASMLLGLLGLLTALVNSHMPAGRPSLWQAGRIAGQMTLVGAPVMLLLFMLFPRFSPLWGTPNENPQARTGLSSRMEVGSIANLALDDSVALRVRFEGTVPTQSSLYFRGPVLSTFDGREWRPLVSSFAPRFRPATDLQVSGEPVRYQVTLEPHQRPWLLVLDAAIDKPVLPEFNPGMNAELEWMANSPILEAVRYSAISYPQFRHGPLNLVAGLQDYLNLPRGFNPRTLQLATEIRQQAPQANAPELIQRVLDQLRTGGYTYTLEPGIFGQHSADEFWFDRKEGFCEHIASSFVILMRALGIPARIVTGYQGGEMNGIDNFWVVRQSDAHAWSEVWIAGQGWQRVDPTAMVSPGRIGSLQRLQQPRGAIASAFETVSPGLLRNLRTAWEAVNNSWNQWVINYTQGKQLKLLKDLGFESPSWEDLGKLLIAALVLASLGGALWALWEKRQHDPWLRLLHIVIKRLQRAGMPLSPGATPREITRMLEQPPAKLARQSTQLRDWLLQLEILRYAPVSQGAGKTELTRLRREFQRIIRTP